MTAQRIACGKLGLTLLVLCFVSTGIVTAQQTARPADPNVLGHPNRSLDDISSDFEKALAPAQSIFTPGVLSDPAKRKEIAPKAIVALKQSVKFLDELRENKDPQGKANADQLQPQIDLFLAMLGDEATQQELERKTRDSNHDAAVLARSTLLVSKWVHADKDAQKQKPMIDEAKQLARDNPRSEQVTQMVSIMGTLGAASQELGDAVQEVAASMQTESALRIKDQLEALRKLRLMENKPLTIEGLRNDGKPLSTADWKGKVILVDFWATWCPPCIKGLPRVKKAYEDFHDKGLEVLGVSSDDDQKMLNKFLAQNRDMPWPQLFDPKTSGLHPLALQYGIRTIPTMFLIDKKGILRTTGAEEDFEEAIPKLLAEKN